LIGFSVIVYLQGGPGILQPEHIDIGFGHFLI